MNRIAAYYGVDVSAVKNTKQDYYDAIVAYLNNKISPSLPASFGGPAPGRPVSAPGSFPSGSVPSGPTPSPLPAVGTTTGRRRSSTSSTGSAASTGSATSTPPAVGAPLSGLPATMAPSSLPGSSPAPAPAAPRRSPPTGSAPTTPSAKKGPISYLKALVTPSKAPKPPKRSKAQKDAADSFATLYGKYQSEGTPLETKVAAGDQAAVEYWTPIILGDETLGPAVNTSGMSLEDMIRVSARRLGINTSGSGLKRKGKMLKKQKGPKALSRKAALEGCFKPSLKTIMEEKAPPRRRTGLTPPKRTLKGAVPSGRSSGPYGKSAYLDGTGRAALIKGIKEAGNNNESIYL